MKRILAFLLSLIAVLSLCGLTVSAASSPTPIEYYAITVGTQGRGEVETNKNAVQKGSDEVVMLVAKETDSPFIGWTVDGTYEIVNGDLNSNVLRIKPNSDIVAIGIFEGGENQTATIIEKSPVSPKTGQSPYTIYSVIGLMVICAAVIIFFGYHLKRRY